MGCGKSSIGVRLSANLGFDFIDTDSLLEEQFGKKIAEIFEMEGEDAFRVAEQKVLQAIVARDDDVVVACGGGMPCFFNAMAMMNVAGITVYLKLTAEMLLKRLRDEMAHRPLLSHQKDLMGYIANMLNERETFYGLAWHCMVVGESDTIADVCTTIQAMVEDRLQG